MYKKAFLIFLLSFALILSFTAMAVAEDRVPDDPGGEIDPPELEGGVTDPIPGGMQGANSAINQPVPPLGIIEIKYDNGIDYPGVGYTLSGPTYGTYYYLRTDFTPPGYVRIDAVVLFSEFLMVPGDVRIVIRDKVNATIVTSFVVALNTPGWHVYYVPELAEFITSDEFSIEAWPLADFLGVLGEDSPSVPWDRRSYQSADGGATWYLTNSAPLIRTDLLIRAWVEYVPGTVTLFNDAFDTVGLGNWTATGLWRLIQPGDPCLGRVSKPNSAAYNDPTTCTFNTGDTNWGTLTLNPSISLPGLTNADCTLTFKSHERTECGDDPCNFDRRAVQVSTDGGSNWYNVWSTYFDYTTENMWHEKWLDLSAYAGETIKLRFLFDTVDSLFNDYRGWYIDNVVVYCGGPDLIVSNLSAKIQKIGSLIGRVLVNYRVKNVGATWADWSYIAFYLSKDAVLDPGDVYVGNAYIPPLGPGQEAPIPFGVNGFRLNNPVFWQVPSTWYVIAVADYTNNNEEISDANNTMAVVASIVVK